MVSLERVRELFRYDPETGHFYRLVATARATKVGEIAGRIKRGFCVNIRIDGRMYKAHRLAWLYMTGAWPADEVDHKNNEPSDNCWENLRAATHQQNMGNIRASLKKEDSDLPRGVYRHRDGVRFQAQIQIDGRKKYLGLFDTPELAHQAWRAQANETRGEFLALQFRTSNA